MVSYRTPPRVPTRAEIDRCLALTDTEDDARDHLLIAMAAMTGLRVHELVALAWGQVRTETGNIRHRVVLVPEHTKGNVGGEIVLPATLRWKLEWFHRRCPRRGLPVEDHDPLFVSRLGRRISVRRVQQVCKAIQARAGIDRPYRMHALRHYFGTVLYTATKDIRLTQVAMRHQSVSSTMIYTHISERQVEAAVERVF